MNKLLVISFLLLTCCGNPEISPGQVWVQGCYIDNPYETAEPYTVIILSVSGEYVQYISSGDTLSTDKYWIPVCGRRIK